MSKTDVAPEAANAQWVSYWSGPGGKRWVRRDAQFDAQFGALTAPILDRANPAAADRILDVGCGAGALTIAARRRIGPTGSVMGIDVSPRMLKRARNKLGEEGLNRVAFVESDAQTAELGDGTFDLVISRLGLMFFDDPTAAFANLARATCRGGRLVATIWQTRSTNAWSAHPLEIVSRVMKTEPPDPASPGPFSLADTARTLEQLRRGGWISATVTPLTGRLHVGGPGSVADAVDFALEQPEIERLLAGAKRGRRAKAVAALDEAFMPRHDGVGVSLPYAAWLLEARR